MTMITLRKSGRLWAKNGNLDTYVHVFGEDVCEAT